MSDDFDDDDFDINDFDDLNSGSTLSEIWKNNPFVKVGVIVAVIALFIAIIIIFGGKKERPDISSVGVGTDVTEAPGSSDASEAFVQAVEEENIRRTEEALRNQGSVVPMPIGSAKGTIELDGNDGDKEDPLDRWRKMQEDRLQKIKKNQVQPTGPVEEPVDTKGPAIAALSQAMSEQMQSILESLEIKEPQFKEIAQIKFLEEQVANQKKFLKEEREEREKERRARNGDDGDDEEAEIILLPAATIEYAQLVTEANTDVPGPILAEIASGPLKGAKLLGSFEVAYQYLTLNFHTVVFEGVSYSTQAVALDPGTTLPGVISEIDRRYFKRIILPTAASFITSFADAVAETGSTTITVNGTTTTSQTDRDLDTEEQIAEGIAGAGRELGDLVSEIADNTRAKYVVRAGTPLGILFVEDVKADEDDDEAVFLSGIEGGSPSTPAPTRIEIDAAARSAQ